MANFNFNLNTDKRPAVERDSLGDYSTSGRSFCNVVMWVVFGAVFATGAVALDLWGDRDKTNAPVAGPAAPTALDLDR